MGLTTWKNAPDGRIRKTDVVVAKNYLTVDELDFFNRIVTMYLDYAEMQAKNKKVMYMRDWVTKLDAFLQFNEKEVLEHKGKISNEVATTLAVSEYEKYRVKQDRIYRSDFDLTAGGDSLALISPDGTYVDRMEFTGGWPEGSNPNTSIERWDFSDTIYGSSIDGRWVNAPTSLSYGATHVNGSNDGSPGARNASMYGKDLKINEVLLADADNKDEFIKELRKKPELKKILEDLLDDDL